MDLNRGVFQFFPAFSTVTNCYREFTRKRESLEDVPRTGRPQTATTTDNRELVRSLVLEDRRITYNMIQSTLGISSWAVSKILHEELGLHKLSSRWIPHLLSEYQKQARVDWCKSMLVKFNLGESNRVSQIVTGDETWIYSYEPEKNTQSQVWVFTGKDAQQKWCEDNRKQMVCHFCW